MTPGRDGRADVPEVKVWQGHPGCVIDVPPKRHSEVAVDLVGGPVYCFPAGGGARPRPRDLPSPRGTDHLRHPSPRPTVKLASRLPPESDTLRRALAAYLARFKGHSRLHTECDMRVYLTWCRSHDLDPLTAQRPHLELYTHWMQEAGRYKPSTVSRLLPHVRHRRRADPLAGRTRPTPKRAHRITHPRTDATAVRSHARLRPRSPPTRTTSRSSPCWARWAWASSKPADPTSRAPPCTGAPHSGTASAARAPTGPARPCPPGTRSSTT